jgi:serine/threonine protein kinase
LLKAEKIEYENRKLFIVFEKMELNMSDWIKKKGQKGMVKLDEEEIKTVMRQVLIGVKFLHDELGIMHRDLKPENIMINQNPLHARIIDFGTCKDLTTETGPHTSYVSTRWYRAPECVLRSHHYNFLSDIFAVGCIMAELYIQRPLFPGANELDQLDRIF